MVITSVIFSPTAAGFGKAFSPQIRLAGVWITTQSSAGGLDTVIPLLMSVPWAKPEKHRLPVPAAENVHVKYPLLPPGMLMLAGDGPATSTAPPVPILDKLPGDGTTFTAFATPTFVTDIITVIN